MTATAHLLASGSGWHVREIVCTAGPDDPAFEERHESCCIALVTHGSFSYRSPLGTALLAPGAILLGNQGACFECGHEHAAGDRCIAFHFEPEQIEDIVAGVPGVRRLAFGRSHLPPSRSLEVLAAEAQTATGDAAYEEIAVRLAGAVYASLAERAAAPAEVSAQDALRITRALRRIEAQSERPLSLAQLASEAAMSRYHFLRVFRAVVGVTPHQLLLRTRLQRAALMLRRSDRPVTEIAYEAGFGDLSTFNRQFRRAMGSSPSTYRRAS